MEINFAKKVMTSENVYWVVARKVEVREYFETKRVDDDILFVAIPPKTPRGLESSLILVSHVEDFNNKYFDSNIFLNNNYPPFQEYISISSVYDGFPIKKGLETNRFIAESIQLKSNDLYQYKELMDSMIPEENKTSNS